MRMFGVGHIAGLIALAALIAACRSGGADPTSEPSTEAPPSPTASTAPDVYPTWTPDAAPNLGGDSEPAGAGQALPPTWTPRAPNTPAPSPTSAGPTETPRPTRTPLPEWCDALVAIEEPAMSITGHPVHLRWGELAQAAHYRVELRNHLGALVVSEVIEATEYDFAGDLFALPGVYGWGVEPLDETGAPICFSISNEIVVRIPPD